MDFNNFRSSRPAGFKIEALYALVSTDERGEGIPMVRGPDGELHLLVDANPKMIAAVAPALAERGLRFRILKFSSPEDVTAQFQEEVEEDEDAENERPPAEDADAPDLGPCCACGKTGKDVRNVVMLHKKAPKPGTGWGCVQCGLPNDGAIAVVCDACMEGPAPYQYRFAADGNLVDHKRIPIDQLTGHHEHDMSKHPEAQNGG